MCFHKEVLETEFGENGIEPLVVTAFREPEPARLASKRTFKRTHRDAQLQAHRLGIGLVSRQERVRAHACQKRKLAGFFQAL